MSAEAPGAASFGGARILRLFDLTPYEVILARCACGQRAEYPLGLPQRLYGVPSDMLIRDLQACHTCPRCGRTGDCDIGILDTRRPRGRQRPEPLRAVASRRYPYGTQPPLANSPGEAGSDHAAEDDARERVPAVARQ